MIALLILAVVGLCALAMYLEGAGYGRDAEARRVARLNADLRPRLWRPLSDAHYLWPTGYTGERWPR